MTADKITFQNILLSAKPDLQSDSFPFSYDVLKFIKSSFVDHMKKLKSEIEVSTSIHSLIDLYLNTLPVNPGQSLHDCGWLDSRKC